MFRAFACVAAASFLGDIDPAPTATASKPCTQDVQGCVPAPAFAACQGPRAPHGPGHRFATLPWSGPQDQADVPYAPYTALNVFDWYAPPFEIAGAAGNPVLVWVHGGGFDEAGDESIQLTDAPFAALHARGYAIVSVRYRQRPSGIFGAAMARDAGYVVQHLRANAANYHVDPDAIAGYGTSSGAFVLGLLAFGPDYQVPGSPDPVLRESSRVDAFLNDRCETDWLHFVDGQITILPFNAPDLTTVALTKKQLASALWWLQQAGAHTVPTISFYRSSVHAPPLVNLHDGWLGDELNNALVALGEAHCSFTVIGTNPIPWNVVEAWFFDVFGY